MFIQYLIDTDRLNPEITPSEDKESYYDPDFMEEWDAMGESTDTSADLLPQILEEDTEAEEQTSISDWEEV